MRLSGGKTKSALQRVLHNVRGTVIRLIRHSILNGTGRKQQYCPVSNGMSGQPIYHAFFVGRPSQRWLLEKEDVHLLTVDVLKDHVLGTQGWGLHLGLEKAAFY